MRHTVQRCCFGKRSVLFFWCVIFFYHPVGQLILCRLGPLTAACSHLSSCACGPAAPLWWPSRTLPERHPWSWRSTPGIQKHWSCRPCLCLPLPSPAPAWLDHRLSLGNVWKWYVGRRVHKRVNFFFFFFTSTKDSLSNRRTCQKDYTKNQWADYQKFRFRCGSESESR